MSDFSLSGDTRVEQNRVLSLTQPWAWVICHANKRIENRDWRHGHPYRGPVWLHACKGIGNRDDFDATVDSIRQILDTTLADREVWRSMLEAGQVIQVQRRSHNPQRSSDTFLRWEPGPNLARGAIVGRATIIDTVPHGGAHNLRDTLAKYPHLNASEQAKWWFHGFALVLDNVQVLKKPVPTPGMLGLWPASNDLVDLCMKELPDAQ